MKVARTDSESVVLMVEKKVERWVVMKALLTAEWLVDKMVVNMVVAMVES